MDKIEQIDIDKIRRELYPGNKAVEALALHNTVKINELVEGYNEIMKELQKIINHIETHSLYNSVNK